MAWRQSELRPLLAAMVATVAAFGASLWLSQYRLLPVEQRTMALSTNALPSARILAASRRDAWQLSSIIDEALLAWSPGADAPAQLWQQARRSRVALGKGLAMYQQLPAYSGEGVYYARVTAALAELDRVLQGLYASGGAAPAERIGRARETLIRIDALDGALAQLTTFNVERAGQEARAITLVRRRAVRTAWWLGGASFVLSVVATALAFLALRQQTVRERELEREKASRRAAEESMRVRDEFLAVVSHELRGPLTSLQLALGNLLPAPQAGDGRDKLLAVATRQSRRMGVLVDQLVDLARVETGRMILQLTEVDLAALLRELVDGLELDRARSGSAIELRAPAPVIGRWDRSAIEQVAVHLLSNAIKFGRGNPIEIEVERRGGRARLAIRDHGIGIPPDECGRVFDRYRRAVSARHFGGLGVGLFVTRELVQAHHGSIGVESVEGEGTTFTVELPLEPVARSAQDS